MKKLSLILGALLAVGAIAQAKEAIIVPPIAEEVVYIEPVVESVIIEEAFRPTGFIGVEYKGYGNTEGHGDENPSTNTWNRGNNNYSRLQTSFGVQATENFKLEGRIRDYNNLERNDSTRINNKKGTDTRLRAYYKHSDLYTSRIEYRDYISDAEKFEYQFRITPYRNNGGLIDAITIAPKYSYTRYNNGTDYKNTVGADLYMTGNLPLGFTWENNVYLDYDMYSKDYIMTGVNNEGKAKHDNKEFVTTWEFYLYNSVPLYVAESHNLAFNFEGGYDPYIFRQYDRYAFDKETATYSKTDAANNTYSLYTAMDVSFTYFITPAVTLRTGAGAEYRNWDIIDQDKAKDWRWQPFAYASMNIKF